MPWFLHRVGANKLSLDAPIWETSRPVVFTSIITYDLTHTYLKYGGPPPGHVFPAEILTDELNCTIVDYWMLNAWREHPSWIPIRSKPALTTCLADLSLDEVSEKAVLDGVALIPVENFGEDVIMCMNLQIAALGYLKMTHEELLTKETFGGPEFPDTRKGELF
jgi:hypothetical protein